MIKNTNEYGQQAVIDTLKALEINATEGLSYAEASQRIGRYGYNAIDEKEEALVSLLLRPY